MPKEPRTVRVTPIAGERFRFHVESWSDPKHPHLVDLAEHNGRGECSCENWKMKRWPRIKANETTAFRCRHVESAWTFYLNREANPQP